ncbi:MAG: LemA family protein [Bacteroidetes bacterium HGW-Bacteroidetes-17]|nr:MAG: LemA family protein [Bacteroidetes bacterium HGW-Bacteroidetes-17]
MKKSWIIIAVIIVAVLVIYSSVKGTYNNMVTYSENINGMWSQVTTDYQRRMDLIPNLVNTVKGYADFEQETLTAVVEARAKATSVNVSADNLTPAMFEQFQAAQQGLSSSLSRLLVTVEKYPELKANQGFLDLQAQLEGTENRIANSRRKFNESTQLFNTYIKKFPKNIYASIFGFETKAYFQATEGAEKAPEVKF